MDGVEAARNAIAASWDTDWLDEDFDWEKAFILAAFSKLAYLEVPEFELRSSKRAQVIPCDEYQARFSGWQVDQVPLQGLQSMELEWQVTVVIRRWVVVTITRLPDVLVVSFRGTTFCYQDLMADTESRLAHFPFMPGSHVHAGFLKAVLECTPEVIERLRESGSRDVPVYVTGHSLGAAMAAIFMGVMRSPNHNLPMRRRHPVLDGYSFGMPRFGDPVATLMFPAITHIYNELDPVPSLPPRMIGYSNPPREVCLSAKPDVIRWANKRKVGGAPRRRSRVAISISDHRIERYLERLQKMRGSSNLPFT